MYCLNCGAENHEESIFCTNCGAKLETTNPFGVGTQFIENRASRRSLNRSLNSDFVEVSEPVPQTLGAAVKVCFRKYASSRGRASRREFWFWQLYCLLTIVLPIAVSVVMIYSSLWEDVTTLAGTIVVALAVLNLLICILPSVMVFFRRLHDCNSQGLWILAFMFLGPMTSGFVAAIVGLCLELLLGYNPNDVTPPVAVALVLVSYALLLVAGLYYILAPGTDGPNRFGLPPKREKAASNEHDLPPVIDQK